MVEELKQTYTNLLVKFCSV